MEIELLTVGKTHTTYIIEGIDEYCRRLKRYISYKITSLNDVKNAGRISEAEQKEAEGRMIIQQIKPGDYIILLDEHGDEPTSVKFANQMQKWMASGRKRILFIVGGPYGFSQDVYNRADGKLSLSRMTFNHEMVRLFFTEQVYRAMTILRGEPYHHE